MDTKDIIKHLSNLCQLDIDAAGAYEQAISACEDHTTKKELEHFKRDHEKHVNDLSSHIRKHGGEPPEHKPGFKGFVLKGFTAIRSASGTEGALRSMHSNENKTNETYKEALKWDVPDDIKELIHKNYQDEQRHLHYIEDSLKNRHWEQRPQP